jgi:hypothetical protein
MELAFVIDQLAFIIDLRLLISHLPPYIFHSVISNCPLFTNHDFHCSIINGSTITKMTNKRSLVTRHAVALFKRRMHDLVYQALCLRRV